MAEPAGSPQAAESSSPSSSSLAALDPEFPPQSRPRSCTWPLPRPELVAVVEPEPGDAAASPEEPGGGGEASGGAAGSGAAAGSVPGGAGGPRKGGGGAGSGGARRNAWGSQSYADLISQAIQSAPDKRLTLAQIYEWMVRSVPYFRDKGDSNSSAGWKNSIRHNLSLHNKFIKVHNEATGKSSWWMLNPEGGKSGKAPRRRAASMDNSSKLAKLRGKTHRKKPAVAAAPEPAADSPGSQFPKWPGSPSSRSNEDSEVWTSIRPRSSSNASSVGLSSVLAEQDDLADEELLPTLVYSSASSNVPPTVTEELELIDGLNLMSASSSSLLAAQQPGSSGAEQRNPPFPLRAPSSAAPASGSFGSSLFSPLDHLLPGTAGHFSHSLEELLTANSPPASDVMMTQVDPILPQSGSRVSSQSYLLLGEQPSKPKVSLGSLLRKPLEQQLGSVGATAVPSAFPLAAASSQGLSALKSPGSASSGQLGPQPAALPATFPAFDGNPDKLPNDLDVDMYMEDLQCDVDYIISTDLMDGEGLDFNFEPLPPTPSYPSTSQASNHSWVPS